MLELNDEIREKLSALIDGELNEFETRQLLKQIDQSEPQYRAGIYAEWQRMQMVSDALQGESINRGLSAPKQDVSFMQAVSQAISSEQDAAHADTADDHSSEANVEYLGTALAESADDDRSSNVTAVDATTTAAPLWSKMAVAASVALAIVVGVQQTQLSAQSEQLLASQGSAGVQSEALGAAAVYDERQVALMADVESARSEQEQLLAQKRLIDYLSARQQSSSSADPFARVATFEEEPAVDPK